MGFNGEYQRMPKDASDKNFVSIKDAARIAGLHPNTLRKMADSDQVASYRTPSGQRRFDRRALAKMCAAAPPDSSVQDAPKQNYLYARVSSKKQLDDLDRQIAFARARDPAYANYAVVSDCASGINFKRPGLSTILDACVQKRIGELVVAHRDRLSRFGFDLIRLFVEKSGGCVVVLEDSVNQSSEQELAEDLLAIVHVYSCRQMGRRRYSRPGARKKCEDSPLSDAGAESHSE